MAGRRFHAVILSETAALGTHNVPFGRWRDGLCDCCALGFCHPVCCLTCWCYPCALGQVLHRMKLNCCANPTADGHYSATSAFKFFFGIVMGVCMVLFIVWVIVTYISVTTTTATYDFSTRRYHVNTSGGDKFYGIGGLIIFSLALLCFFVTMRLRTYVREWFNIPGSRCEDCCCSFWCMQCTICQLARHTADFKTHLAGCCTDNGLFHPGSPDVV
jgi:Cys-rich protein (TIGR01571 family)